uniref:Uncharacterized protein n=1 Tax=Arundo donax TaxID=35708 RepID=A0A0A8ZDB9_ARUDO
MIKFPEKRYSFAFSYFTLLIL